MRIAFNLKYFRAGRIGGQESVIRQLAAGLSARPLSAGQQMFAICPPEEREAVAGMCSWAGIAAVAMHEGERRMAGILRRLRPDLYICPMAFIEPADPPCPTVVGIPDLQHETLPELFSPEKLANRRRTYGDAVRRADLILTLSEYARGTILACYPSLPPARVVAARPGLDPELAAHMEGAPAAPPAHLGLPVDYLLYPANFWPHKNHARLIEALAGLRAAGLTPPLVLTGDPGSGFDRVEPEIERRGLTGQVRFLGRLPAADLVPVMRGARALVFPSLYEGFGLPILEAFHCDTGVLCSRAGSCPEVAGDAALFVDARSAESIGEGLRRIWTDAGLRETLVAKGRLRCADFRWSQTIETVRDALLAIPPGAPLPSGRIRRFFQALGLARLSL